MICENCDHVETVSRKQTWYHHLCLKSPKATPVQFVVADPFLTEAPFKFCCRVNSKGDCEMFEPRKEAEDASK